MEIKHEFKEIVTKLEKRQAYVTNELIACPDGHLSFVRSGKRSILVQENRKSGVRHRHTLSKNTELAAALLRKEALQDEHDALERNIQLIYSVMDKMQDYSENMELIKLMKRYPGVDASLFKGIYNNEPLSAWASEEYEQATYKPEERRHVNSHGLKLRSKSEVLISEKLYEFNVEFRYEQVLRIGRVTVIPDFTIRRKDGKLFIWEHEGLTNVKSYLDWQRKKAELYAEGGFVPWENLIITYDNADGIIDLRIVESEIVNKLII